MYCTSTWPFLDNFQAANSLDILRGLVNNTGAMILFKWRLYGAMCITKYRIPLKSFNMPLSGAHAPQPYVRRRFHCRCALASTALHAVPLALFSVLYSCHTASVVCIALRAHEAAPW